MSVDIFLQKKEDLLLKLNNYISSCSALSPPPLDYIDNLNEMKEDIKIANEAELALLSSVWDKIKPKDKNNV